MSALVVLGKNKRDWIGAVCQSDELWLNPSTSTCCEPVASSRTHGSSSASRPRSNIVRSIVLVESVAAPNKPPVIGQHGILFGVGEERGNQVLEVVFDRAKLVAKSLALQGGGCFGIGSPADIQLDLIFAQWVGVMDPVYVWGRFHKGDGASCVSFTALLGDAGFRPG